jgi:hypothetical protein
MVVTKTAKSERMLGPHEKAPDRRGAISHKVYAST